MNILNRRSFVASLLALPSMVSFGQRLTSAASGFFVASGKDRLDRNDRKIGVSNTTFKVVNKDSQEDMFIMEHRNVEQGGPPKHVHLEQDEWWYVIDGRYIVEIGERRYSLGPGDSVFGPRLVPHVWAFVGDTPGRMLIAFAPAGKMQAAFERIRTKPGYLAEADQLKPYGMELVGPPLKWK